MTALAAALARAQAHAPRAETVKKLDTKGRLKTVKGKPKFPGMTPEEIMARAIARDHDLMVPSVQTPDLGWHDKAYRHASDKGHQLVTWIKPKPGFKLQPILTTTRLAHPGKGDHTKAFAITHNCDAAKWKSVAPIATDNYVPERPKTSKAVLVRKLIRGKS